MANNHKVTKYRRPVNINIGMVIFAIIFVYVIICVVMFFTQKHIIPYEVKAGSLTSNNIYRGIALRNETVVTAAQAGYINYLIREGTRTGQNNPVYAVDQLGELNEYLKAEEPGVNTLSASDLFELKNEIAGFVHTFNSTQFNTVYDFKYNVQGTVLKLANYNVLKGIEEINTANTQMIFFGRAPLSGIVVYSVDGYEDITLEDMTEEMFDQQAYTKTQLITNELIGEGDPVYKLSTSEDWSIVIQTEPEKAEELLELEYVKVRFLKDQNLSWGEVSTFTNEAGETFVQLTFTNSMLAFCMDRFIDIELITEEETGLKIPNSAIVQKEFFIVPREYITRGGENNILGVLRERYTEEGEQTTEFIEVTIYRETETEYYLDDMILQIGDDLIKPDSTETYTLSKRGSLTGVYNINRGYADFKQISILYENEEYSIVSSNTQYGLSVYDYIVLDAMTVNENELIYE